MREARLEARHVADRGAHAVQRGGFHGLKFAAGFAREMFAIALIGSRAASSASSTSRRAEVRRSPPRRTTSIAPSRSVTTTGCDPARRSRTSSRSMPSQPNASVDWHTHPAVGARARVRTPDAPHPETLQRGCSSPPSPQLLGLTPFPGRSRDDAGPKMSCTQPLRSRRSTATP